MGHAMKVMKVLPGLLVLGATVCAADDRLAVLEFFGRPAGAYCSAAGPAMITLQDEMRGSAVLLEYDYDQFATGRVDRWWATGASGRYLPLVMVGSGYRTSSGQVEYEPVYRSLVDDELARPARASVNAYWRRSGNSLRLYVDATNLGSTDVTTQESAALWVIAWENAPIGVSTTWVRATVRRPLSSSLAPGETETAVIDTAQLSGVDWSRMACLALLEDRPGGGGRYDMLQAVEAVPAALTTAPDSLVLSPARPTAEVILAGPHVLSWSAAADVPWLQVTPAGASLPATLTVTLLPDLCPRTAVYGTIEIEAAGDGMALSTEVSVAAGREVRRATGRLRP